MCVKDKSQVPRRASSYNSGSLDFKFPYILSYMPYIGKQFKDGDNVDCDGDEYGMVGCAE